MLDDKYLLLFELISEANQKRIHLGGSPDESLNYFLDDIIYFGVGLRNNMLHECSMPAVVGISGRIGEGTLFFWGGGRGAPAKILMGPTNQTFRIDNVLPRCAPFIKNQETGFLATLEFCQFKSSHINLIIKGGFLLSGSQQPIHNSTIPD